MPCSAFCFQRSRDQYAVHPGTVLVLDGSLDVPAQSDSGLPWYVDMKKSCETHGGSTAKGRLKALVISMSDQLLAEHAAQYNSA